MSDRRSATQSHRDAVAGLRSILTETMREVAGKAAQRGHLDWHEYIEMLKEELRRRLTEVSE